MADVILSSEATRGVVTVNGVPSLTIGGSGIVITDANNATINGAIYQVNAPYTNCPVGSEGCVIEVKSENGHITQHASVYNSTFAVVTYFVRFYNGGAWSDWLTDTVSGINISGQFAAVTTARIEQNVSGTYDVVLTATSYALTMTANTTIGFNQFFQIDASTLTIDMYVFGAFTPTFSGVTWEGGSVPPYVAGQRYQFTMQKNNVGTTSVLGRVNTPSIGNGQVWTDVTGSRALSTTYTNSTGRPISVQVRAALVNASSSMSLNIAGIQSFYAQGQATANVNYSLSGIVPNGATYVVAVTGSLTLSQWTELR